MYKILRIATPFCECSWARYDVLQCHFVDIRGYGYDKSDPYAYGVDVAKRG
ncbi:MAG: hypothetical protein HXN82_03040 [Prevotella pallens]|nr:hypothetical protein [Prevotella pallens]